MARTLAGSDIHAARRPPPYRRDGELDGATSGLRDEAGNARPRQSVRASTAPARHHVPLTRLRQRPPGSGRGPGPRRPTRTAAWQAGRVEIRRRGIAEWRALGDAAGRAPSSSPRFPTTSSSVARTSFAPPPSTRSATRPPQPGGRTGARWSLDLPVRADTTLSASLSRRSAGARPRAADAADRLSQARVAARRPAVGRRAAARHSPRRSTRAGSTAATGGR